MKVEVLIPCLADQFSPETAQNLYKILRHIGVEAHYPEQQTCCGLSAYNAGFWDEAKILGGKFINEFNTDKYVIMPSVSCANMVKNHYNRFFYNTSLHLEYKKLQSKVYEISDFLINVMNISVWKGKFKARVMLHANCSPSVDYCVKNETIQLLNLVQELTLIEHINTKSCGFGGGFSIAHPQISANIALDVINEGLRANAQYIVTQDTSCMLQLKSVAEFHKIDINITTITDILAESLKYSDAIFSKDKHIALG